MTELKAARGSLLGIEHLSAKEIMEHLKPLVAKWWLPDEVIFIDAVPKTSVGKFDKKVLRERFKNWKPRASGG